MLLLPHSQAGYDLTHLFIGSEGTLGIATEITLKLKRRPEKLAVAVCNFPSARDAASTVIQTMQAGVQIGRSELLDEVMIKAVNIHSDMKLPVAPTLFFEFRSVTFLILFFTSMLMFSSFLFLVLL
jgi:D-lactate dehydrogenase (cytochrome)